MSSNPTLGKYPKVKAGSLTGISLFSTAKRWKQPKSSLINDWINKMWPIHTMEYYSALKKKEILTHVTTWTNLEDIMQSEISHTPKDKYCMILLPWGPRIVILTETERRIVVTRGWGGAGGEWGVFDEDGVSVGKMIKFWRWMVAMAAHQCECT